MGDYLSVDLYSRFVSPSNRTVPCLISISLFELFWEMSFQNMRCDIFGYGP